MQEARKTYLSLITLIQLESWSVQSLLDKKVSYNKKFTLARIGDFLKKSRKSIDIKDDQSYQRVRIKIRNGGVEERDVEKGVNIGTKKQFVASAGQFVVSKIDARNGAFGLIPENLEGAIVTNDFPLFEVDKTKILPEFLVLITTTNEFINFAQSCSSGTTNRQRMDIDLFLNQKIPLPSIDEQQLIVNAYNEKIESANSLEKEAEELEKEIERFLLNSLEIKITNKDKNIGLNIIQSSSFERWGVDYLFKLNSLRFISEGKYEAMKVANLLTSFQYGISEKAFVEPIGLPMLRMNNIYKSDLSIENLKYINTIAKEKLPGLLLNKGDLLFNRTNSKELVGKTAVFDLDGDFLFASYLIRLKFDLDKVNVYYMNYLFNSTIGRTQIDMTSRQILGQANINSQELQEFIFPIPPLSIQNEIVDHINTIKSQIKHNLDLSSKLRVEAASDFEKEIFN